MSVQLILKNPNFSDEKLQTLTEDLNETLNSEANIRACPIYGESVPGSKGEPITLGVIALAFFTGGSAAALINVLNTYVKRSSNLEFEIKDGDRVIKITEQNIKTDQVMKVR